MKIDFTKKEVDYFKENCYFNEEEERILDMRLRNISIKRIAFITNNSERTVNRIIKRIKQKIMKVL